MPAAPIQSETVRCPWCGSTVIVPEPLRPPRPKSFTDDASTYEKSRSGLQPVHVIVGVMSLLGIMVLAGILMSGPKKASRPVSFAPSPYPRLTPTPRATPTPVGPTVLLTFGEKGTGHGLFKDAQELAVDAGGNIYVSDDTLRIQKFDSEGKFVNLWTISEKGAEDLHEGPHRLQADRAGNVYAVFGGIILKYDGETGERHGVAHGTDYITDAAMTADGGMMVVSSKDGDDELVHLGPNGRAVGRVHKFASTVAGKRLEPEALRLAVDGVGNTYALYALGSVYGEHWYDSEDLAVYKINPSGRYVSKFGSGGDAAGQFRMPVAIAVDNQGRVYVADQLGEIKVFADDGRYLESFKPPHTVTAMAFDAENHLYIVGSDRVSKLQLSK